ncbi:MAG: hypothetical protein KC657_12700 [Myxococcales bacterium]|nr:hypothetical protein [Myxococcales bacterium]
MLARRFSERIGRARPLSVAAVLIPALALAAGLAAGRGAHADDAPADRAERSERCAVRLSIALTGKSPDAALMGSADPQSRVDAMLASPEFAERMARFVNAQLNGGPQADATDDPVYYLAKHVVSRGEPWAALFTGPYSVTPTADAMQVTDDPAGLGYFRTPSWMKRYAGNEDQGYMLVGAFRIIANTTGLELMASVGNPGDDRSAEGRKGPECKGCHYDRWYALDTFAKLLPRKRGQGDAITFSPPTEGPQQLLGKTIKDDKELVSTLVASDAFKFHQCRMVFQFLYGRAENQCEATVFDACVDALSSAGTIQSAVAAVAKDPTFCAN